MAVIDQEIDKLSRLARLKLSGEEEKELASELDEILELAEKINEVDTEGVEPTYHALPLTNVFREDAVQKSSAAESVLRNAPESSDDYFVVPRVIEDE